MSRPRSTFPADPKVGVEGGVKAGLEYPCPGKATLDAYATGSIGGDLEFLKKKLAEYSIESTVTRTVSILSSAAFGCLAHARHCR